MAARSRRLAALSRHREATLPARALPPHRGGRAVHIAARYQRRHQTHRRADLGRNRRGSERGSRDPDGRAAGLGRCRARPQGHTDELSSVSGGGRCDPGRDPCGARAGPVLVDQRAPGASGGARSAGAELPPSPADPRRRRQKAFQVDAGHRPARAPRARPDAGPGC